MNHTVHHISEFPNTDPIHASTKYKWVIVNEEIASIVHSCPTKQQALDLAREWNSEEDEGDI